VYVRENGALRPFMYRGIETGFYDLRLNTTDYAQWDAAFGHIKQANANTVEFLIHLLDIEPEEGRFDWTVTDYVVSLCEKHGLKTRLVFFTSLFTGQHLAGHTWNPSLDNGNTLVKVPDPADPWLYGDENNIQWSFNRATGAIQSKTYMDYYNAYQVIYLCYANPYVTEAVGGALRALCGRYKDCGTVVGYQVTNEEGMQWRVPNGDANPHTAVALREFIKTKYGGVRELNAGWGTSYGSIGEVQPQTAPFEKWGDFRRDLTAGYIRGLMRAGHEADPYKPFFMNIYAGEESFRDYGLYNHTATDASTYARCCTDGVAAMLYRPGYRDKTVLNRINDEININAPADVLLATTELGIGRRYWDKENQFAFNVYQYLQRGGQGYAAYDWGEFVTPCERWHGHPNEVLSEYRDIADMVQRNEGFLIGALPVDTVLPARSFYRLSTDSPYFEVTTLKQAYDSADMAGLCYNYSEREMPLTVEWIPAQAGDYEITFDMPGKPALHFTQHVDYVEPDASYHTKTGRIALDLGAVAGKSIAIIKIIIKDE